MTTTGPDLTLILRAQSGERDALDRTLQNVQYGLYRYIRGVVGDPAEAEDVLQETLFRIARKVRWLSQPQAFRAWAFRIASREAYRAMGKRRSTVPLDEIDPTEFRAAAPAPEPLSASERDTLRSAVARCSPGSRAVLLLHYFEDLSLEEVADALEIPLGTVKSRLGYGLRQLRRNQEDPR